MDCLVIRRRQTEEAPVVIMAVEDRASPVSREQHKGAVAHRDPLSKTNGILVGSNGLAVSTEDSSADAIDAERQARRERALRAQRQQAEEAAADSESEYDTVC